MHLSPVAVAYGSTDSLLTGKHGIAKVTIRMLLAVATPTHMMEPISDGTLVPVTTSTGFPQSLPAAQPG